MDLVTAVPDRHPDVNLLVGIVSNRGWSVRFGRSLFHMGLFLGSKRIGGRLVDASCIITEQGQITSRNEHLCKALDNGFTHFLSLDDDQTFPADLVDRFLANSDDHPVLTTNYVKKSTTKVEGVCCDMDRKRLDSVGKTGLQQVSVMGMGCTFIRLDAIRHIPRPFYAVLWDAARQSYMLEDEVFSGILAEHGVEIWCDHDLSQSIGHCGEVEFRVPRPPKDGVLVPKVAAE